MFDSIRIDFSAVNACKQKVEQILMRIIVRVRKEAAFLYQHVKKELDRRKEICHQLINRLRSMEERSEVWSLKERRLGVDNYRRCD